MKIKKFRKEVLFQESMKADKAYIAGIKRRYGSDDSDILAMLIPQSIVAASSVLRQAADARINSL